MRAPANSRSQRHFFKFIRPGFIHQVPIPKSFTKYLNGQKSEFAFLRREGRKWPVKIDEGWVFGKGWEKFVKENGVEACDFLVFKHEGNMVFEVMVFEYPSTCERDYPLVEAQQFPGSKSFKQLQEINEWSKKIMKGGEALSNSHPERKPSSFKIGDRPYFKSTLTPYNIKRSILSIPLEFARSNGLINRNSIILRDVKKRSWPMRLKKDRSHVYVFGLGDFQIANGLKEGDDIMLQFVENGIKPIMNFHSITNNSNKPSESCNIEAEAKGSDLRDKPFKTPVESSYCLRNRTLEPRVKAETKGSDLRDKPIIETPVESSYCLRNRILEPRVKAETKGSDLGYKPIIETPVESSYLLGNKPFNSRTEVETKGSDLRNKHIKAERTTMTSTLTGHPSFKSIVTPYNIKRSILYIPLEFARSNGLMDRNCEIIMRDEKKRSWEMRLRTFGTHVSVVGWGDLQIAYGLNEGDAFLIELIENEKKPIMNFHDLRNQPLDAGVKAEIEGSSLENKPVKFPINAETTLNNHSYFVSSESRIKNEIKGLDLGHKPFKPCVEAEIKGSDLRHQPIVKSPVESSYCLRNKAFESRISDLRNKHIKAKNTTSTSTLTGHPSFKSIVTPFSIKRSILYIPMEFARSNGLNDRNCEIIMTDERQRSCAMRLKMVGAHVSLMGWGNLLIAYGLKEGDAFMIELIKNGDKPIMNFHDLRNKPLDVGVKAEIEGSSLGSKPVKFPIKADTTLNNHPYFVSTLKPCNIKQSLLYLPKEFTRSNGLSNGKMILRNENQRSWTVELRDVGHYVYIAHGWKDFHIANHLKEGNCFKFELVENGKKPVAIFYRMA